MILSPQKIKRAIEYYCMFIGFELTREQFVEILDENPHLKRELTEVGTDTVSRENFMDALAKKVTAMSWPINMTPDDKVRQFKNKMITKGRKMGYLVPDDFMD